MRHSEQLTTAQRALLNHVSHLEAEDVFRHLALTLSLSIGHYQQPEDDEHAPPTASVLQAWRGTLHLLTAIHDVAVEQQPR